MNAGNSFQPASAAPSWGSAGRNRLDERDEGETAPNTSASLHWYCLRTRPKREHFAAVQLIQRTGLEAFAPRLTLRRTTRSGAAATVTEALFPGYLFARFRLSADVRHVVSTPDISGLVRLGEHTPAVPEALISLLRTHAGDRQAYAPVLAEGDWIEILSGCLAGNEGRIVAFDAAGQRAWVLLALLGQELRINVPVAALRRSGPAHLDFPPQLLASCG